MPPKLAVHHPGWVRSHNPLSAPCCRLQCVMDPSLPPTPTASGSLMIQPTPLSTQTIVSTAYNMVQPALGNARPLDILGPSLPTATRLTATGTPCLDHASLWDLPVSVTWLCCSAIGAAHVQNMRVGTCTAPHCHSCCHGQGPVAIDGCSTRRQVLVVAHPAHAGCQASARLSNVCNVNTPSQLSTAMSFGAG